MWSLDHLSVNVPSRGLYKTKPPSPRVIKSLIQVPQQGQETRTKNKKTVVVGGHKDHVSACLCHMLYCIEISTLYNLAFFILKRMEKTRFKPKELLPYGTDKSKIKKRVKKTGKHGHENQKSTKRSQRSKAEARNIKLQSNPIKSQSKMVNKSQQSSKP
ncbi:hypothetical protein Tco_1504829 [Tanacetum coccineum]